MSREIHYGKVVFTPSKAYDAGWDAIWGEVTPVESICRGVEGGLCEPEGSEGTRMTPSPEKGTPEEAESDG
jgi:hypothetical protein